MRRTGLLLVALLLVPRAGSPQQGTPLGPEFRVNTYTTGSQFGGSVAADAVGNFVVVWTSNSQDGSSNGVFGQRYASTGAALGPEFRVNTYTPGSQFGGSVAADAVGDFVVVWTSNSQDGSSYGVFGQRYASGGTPLGPEFRVNTFTTSIQDSPHVAADAAGNFVVVWTSNLQDGSDSGAFGQRFASSGTPLGPEFRVNTSTAYTQWPGSVAADSAGNFVVVWTSAIFPPGNFFGQRFASSGAPLGPEFLVNTPTTDYLTAPSVAADSAGGFVVVWSDNGDDGYYYITYVMGKRYASGGTPLGEFRITTEFPSNFGSTNPAVAADPAGNFVVVWNGITEYGTHGQRYDGAGTPLGGEFRVNTYTPYCCGVPAVAADGLGNFVVVWQNVVQDGDISGQRFGPILPVELMHWTIE